MTHPRDEITQWLLQRGHSQAEVEKILTQLDAYDEHSSRESLFEDLSNGAFDIGPIIAAALKGD